MDETRMAELVAYVDKAPDAVQEFREQLQEELKEVVRYFDKELASSHANALKLSDDGKDKLQIENEYKRAVFQFDRPPGVVWIKVHVIGETVCSATCIEGFMKVGEDGFDTSNLPEDWTY